MSGVVGGGVHRVAAYIILLLINTWGRMAPCCSERIESNGTIFMYIRTGIVRLESIIQDSPLQICSKCCNQKEKDEFVVVVTYVCVVGCSHSPSSHVL